MPRFQVVRSIEISASPDQVFEIVADFRTWPKWSPWLCVEPEAGITISNPANAVGSTYAWDGELVGAGELEHLALERGRSIRDAIRFQRPFRSSSSVGFELEPVAAGTRLTWKMDGSLPWFLFFLCSQMELFIGMDYERGLRMFKEFVETGQVLSRTIIRGTERIGPLRMAGIRRSCPFDEIGASMDAAVAEAREAFSRHGFSDEGQAITFYHKVDLRKKTFDFTSGFVIPDSLGSLPGNLVMHTIPVIKSLVVEHHGRYEHLSNSWNAAYHYARFRKLKLSRRPAFEIYINSQEQTPVEHLLTEIYVPIQ